MIHILHAIGMGIRDGMSCIFINILILFAIDCLTGNYEPLSRRGWIMLIIWSSLFGFYHTLLAL